ncbi:MAG: PAS domain S-box-containing protein [Desulforhopalus sp.]|jgi:PAS domain S-box-containing protein
MWISMFGVLKKQFGNKIGNKLFSMFVLVVGLAIFPLGIQVLKSVNTFGEYSTKVNEEQIRTLAISSFSRLSREQGHHYEEYFSKISAVVGLLSTQASGLYTARGSSALLKVPPVELHFQEDNQMFVTDDQGPGLVHYWGGTSLSAEILSEIDLLQGLDSSLLKAKDLLPEALAIHVITTSGLGKYYTNNKAAHNAAQHLPRVTDFDLRAGAPLSLFNEAEGSLTEVRWTKIYKDEVTGDLIVTVAGPVVDSKGELLGIVGIDLPIDTIVDGILETDPVGHADGRKILCSFLMNCDGDIIAYPMALLSIFGIDSGILEMENSDDVFDYNLKQSTKPGVKELVGKILEKDCIVEQFLIEGDKHLVVSQTLSPQGWKLVMVAREDELLFSVEQTRQALGKIIWSLKVKYIFYSFCLGLIILIFSYLAVKHFVGPLQKLSLLAQRVGEGDLSQKASLDRPDELGTLSLAMNTMIERLASAESLKKEYFLNLQDGIDERTVDLQKKNLQLNEVMLKVHLESEKRKKISNALQERERQLGAIMEASLAGLCIVQGNKFKFVNSAIEKMFGYTKKELVDKVGPIDLIAPEYKADVLERLHLKEKGQYKKHLSPYHVKCLRKNNDVFDVEVDGSFITWKGAPASVGTMVDISEHIRAKEKISDNEKRLKRLLEEKDILLREVYHRTKNNMLVIISMLALQMDEIEDKAARKIFEEMEHRIRAMALVHENLYQSENLVEINLGEYLAKMARTQVEHMTFSDQIEVRADYCQVTVPFDQAVPLGLVVSELITNSVKHAFPAGQRGIIRIRLAKKNGVFNLIVEDNGVGLPPEIDVNKATSFGLQITTNMIIKQLEGTLRVDRSHGTAFHIEFKGVKKNG